MPRRKDPRIPDGVGGQGGSARLEDIRNRFGERAKGQLYRPPAGGWPRHSSRVAWRIVRCRIQLTRCRQFDGATQVPLPKTRPPGVQRKRQGSSPVFALFVVDTCTNSTCSTSAMCSTALAARSIRWRSAATSRPAPSRRTRPQSLVIRHITPMSTRDRECDIHDADAWRLICRCINGGEQDATAEIPLSAEEG